MSAEDLEPLLRDVRACRGGAVGSLRPFRCCGRWNTFGGEMGGELLTCAGVGIHCVYGLNKMDTFTRRTIADSYSTLSMRTLF